jgi:hypothetical protein
MPKLVRQGRAEGHRVGGQPVAGLGYQRRRKNLFQLSWQTPALRAAPKPLASESQARCTAGATDDDRPSLQSLSEEAGRRPRRGRPQLGTLSSPALVMKILEAERGAEAAARLAFPHHQAGGHHLG